MIAGRQRALITAVAVLLLANAVYWWPQKKGGLTKSGGSTMSRQLQLDDFRLRTGVKASAAKVQRDIFRPKVVERPKPVVKAPPPPPKKSPEELAREAAEAELARIRCAGVLFRDQKGQAFMLNGTEQVMVGEGEKIGTRFVVERITPTSVRVKDPQTGVGKEIPVAGQ